VVTIAGAAEQGAGPANCVFCAVVRGSEPASFVYRDDQVVGIMSLDQPTRHKVLVLPREHVETIFDLSDEQAGSLFRAAADIARAVRAASGCVGLNVVQSNGSAAGQDVPHFHMHLLPRAAGDQIRLDWPARRAERAELDTMAAEIGRNMRAN
jgi:histidine triad (HIT) family protein